MSGDGAPLSLIEKQIKDDYYKADYTLRQIFYKYRRYDRKEIVKILGLYELENEPEKDCHGWGTFAMRWETECRRLNPKAWEGR